MTSQSEKPDIMKEAAKGEGHTISWSIVRGITIFLDSFIILSFGLAEWFYYVGWHNVTAEFYISAVLFIWISFLFVSGYARLREWKSIMSPLGSTPKVIVSYVVSALLFLTLAFAFKSSIYFSRYWLYTILIGTPVLLVCGRVLIYGVLRQWSTKGHLSRNIVFVGGNIQAKHCIERIRAGHNSFTKIIGIFDDRKDRIGPEVSGVPVLGDMSDLFEYCRHHRVDDIIVSLPWSADERLVRIVTQLRELPVHVYLGYDLAGFRLPCRQANNTLAGVSMMEVVKMPLSGWGGFIKRAEDIIIASIAVIVFSPVLLLVALAIRMESKGPIIFKQNRFGYNNQTFKVFKFRSMYYDKVPTKFTKQATADDPRITRVGRFIRKTSLDELPQLFNVLNGTMSLVGPRPHAVDHNEMYSKVIGGYYARHKVRPGITGWAQVNGLRGETDTVQKMADRVQHDVYYVENWSLLFDFRILVMTVFVGFVNKNAY